MNHRAYTGWPIETLFAEMDRLDIPRSCYEEVLLAHKGKTGRWCAVQVLVEHRLVAA